MTLSPSCTCSAHLASRLAGPAEPPASSAPLAAPASCLARGGMLCELSRAAGRWSQEQNCCDSTAASVPFEGTKRWCRPGARGHQVAPCPGEARASHLPLHAVRHQEAMPHSLGQGMGQSLKRASPRPREPASRRRAKAAQGKSAQQAASAAPSSLLLLQHHHSFFN